MLLKYKLIILPLIFQASFEACDLLLLSIEHHADAEMQVLILGEIHFLILTSHWTKGKVFNSQGLEIFRSFIYWYRPYHVIRNPKFLEQN
ncbi:hypothetical protein SLEP1_g60064 [Rubroshorea leprosula]|uniref:Secreted protein n=1 Tax=Rubroshorea leprosula TaxID=152421 RepID=A0AAV5MVE8_9ROSI|nr:hypothetical protein SLEP1_g60064 [Rubroshorea leprosula]